ncbi:hypothetical protein NQ314_020563 [Rhamnusium bicolor]|uniref:DNA replication complex GINS protein PSF3 n=1 Tax=Rhamnusium bicolor TaxID=1586634 RepID=A0AAV8WL91_9CUCU|nr:hypothetical protein NQ314_020563 [Rhamnusium bicolor]
MPLPSAYCPNYYSIDDILATQERSPSKFLLNVPKMGKLNPSEGEIDLKAGTTLELPTWLVLEICTGRQPIVMPDLPKIYKESYREILKADACATFKTRFRQLMDLADNSISDPSVQQRLDTLERRLFRDSYNARTKLNAWLIESGATIEAANMVVNHKKRKRIDVEDLIN